EVCEGALLERAEVRPDEDRRRWVLLGVDSGNERIRRGDPEHARRCRGALPRAVLPEAGDDRDALRGRDAPCDQPPLRPRPAREARAEMERAHSGPPRSTVISVYVSLPPPSSPSTPCAFRAITPSVAVVAPGSRSSSSSP